MRHSLSVRVMRRLGKFPFHKNLRDKPGQFAGVEPFVLAERMQGYGVAGEEVPGEVRQAASGVCLVARPGGLMPGLQRVG